ncbi:MAG: hypothetical protein IPO24_09875 [Bacteroidetes bacterium]|nr:hypothetical protein [Bacteroidota bacterium]
MVTRYFTDVEVQDPAFSKTLINCLKTAYPLVKFINSAIE